MDDFRTILYSRYVSTLKRGQKDRNRHRIQQFFRAYQYRFVPLLAGIGFDAPILEVGCGPGYLLEFLKDQGYKNAEGIDISNEQVQLALEQGLNVSVADVSTYLAGKQNAFKVIFAIDFVEHFSKSELLTLLPLVHNALTDNGLFIVQTPNGQGLFPGQVIYGDLTHLTIFAEDSLRQILQMNGFDEIRFKETDPIPDSLGGKVNLFLWKIIRAMIRLIRQIEANNSSKLWTENIIAWCRRK